MRLLRDFFDVERGESCTFVGTGPIRYCLPVGMARHDEGFGAFAAFADRACTRPLAIAGGEGAAPYAIVRPVDACAAPPRVHRAGSAKMAKPWIFDGERCRQQAIETIVQPLEEEIPLDAFARADVRLAGGGSRLASIVAVSGDGAVVPLGVFDRVRGEAVRVMDRYEGATRWVPANVAFVGANAPLWSASCTTELATKIARDSACPLTAAFVFAGECAEGVFHALGPSPNGVFAKEGEQCAAVPPVEGMLHFAVGAAIDPNAFALASIVETGAGRIRRRGFAGPDGSVVSWGELVDAVTGEPCEPAVALDGAERCLPTATASIDLFADEACTLPAFAVAMTGCETGPFARFVRSGERVFEVTNETSLFEASGTSCKRHVPPVPSRGYAVRELDATQFVIATPGETP